MSERKLILVIGGTGAQGIPVVEALSASQDYSALLLTRNPSSPRALTLASLPHVTLLRGTQDSLPSLHAAFAHNPYGAWVNTDGFTLGEKNELFYGIRTYEIARHYDVKHFIWANTDYALKVAGWDERYHWGHNDAKGRVGDLILAHGREEGGEGMVVSLLTTGPYVDMLFDGMFLPEERGDGGFVWRNPAVNGKIPLIALSDVGKYSLYLLSNPTKTHALNLAIATEQVSFPQIAETFTRVTGIPASHEYIPLEEYIPLAEPYPNAYANWALGPDAPRDESVMTWRENFSAWWRFWGEGKGANRDMGFLDEVLPGRVRSLEEWMRGVGYDGRARAVLKGLEDLRGGKERGKGGNKVDL
ncbi:hypothetical protein PRZ48_009504 [Zasmidium cellare]|uniref:NmrA-like domain-containing protein n=1 Tax=Zasmidium cellare TaxID=395010 RepID=A0ABR0ECQ9_ZASCE|nr:hypothetical protein PRZ48_009504 [Zasmidium cellare]